MSPIGRSTLTLASLSLLIVQSNALCQKYVDSAKEAAGVLQSKYWNGNDYGSQAVWISGVDAFYLDTRTFLVFLLPIFSLLTSNNS